MQPTTYPSDLDPEGLAQWYNTHWWARTLMEAQNMRMVSVTPDMAVAEAPIHDGLRNGAGSIHAATFVALADTAATCLVATAVNAPGQPARFPLALDISMQLVGNVTEGMLRCESTPVSIGRTISVVQTRVTNGEGKLLALVTSTHYVRGR